MATATRFLHLSKLRRLRETEQVAAVCYRLRGSEVQFLLVQTGAGRWIFPKGSVEPGLTHAQAAAIEAFEEAGVHGRIEEKSFSRYRGRRAGKKGKQRVMAHLCEVLRLGPPQESGRNRTWFTVEKAKHRLREDRTVKEGNEMAQVVSRAVTRIAETRSKDTSSYQVRPEYCPARLDSLQKVQLEATAIAQLQHPIDPMYMRYIRRLRNDSELWADSKISGFLSKPRFRLGSGSPAMAGMQKVTAIDQIRGERGKARG